MVTRFKEREGRRQRTVWMRLISRSLSHSPKENETRPSLVELTDRTYKPSIFSRLKRLGGSLEVFDKHVIACTRQHCRYLFMGRWLLKETCMRVVLLWTTSALLYEKMLWHLASKYPYTAMKVGKLFSLNTLMALVASDAVFAPRSFHDWCWSCHYNIAIHHAMEYLAGRNSMTE